MNESVRPIYHHVLPEGIYDVKVVQLVPDVSVSQRAFTRIILQWIGTDRQIIAVVSSAREVAWSVHAWGAPDYDNLNVIMGCRYKVQITHEVYEQKARERVNVLALITE
jgi:hypothetical protein